MTSFQKENTLTLKDIFLLLFSAYLALLSLIFGAGIGKSLNIYDRTFNILFVLAIFYFIINAKNLFLTERIFIIIFAIFLQCLICHFKTGYTYLEYLRIFLIFIPLAFFSITNEQLTLISKIYGAFGMSVLLVANFTSLFSGWDGNSISLNAFFAYALFIVSFSNIKNQKSIIYLVIYSIIYYLLLIKFDCRSTILFSIFLFLSIFSIIPVKKILNKTWLIIILIIPLLIALFIVAIKDTDIIQKLNTWSLNTFHKSIFNGRDTLWTNGFNKWLNYPLFGTGNISYSAHNSAVSLLVTGGIAGYLIFLSSIYTLLKKALFWIDDHIVFGLILAFLTIWIQQSVELGLFGLSVNPTPYFILALLYFKIKSLEKNNETDTHFFKHNNPGL